MKNTKKTHGLYRDLHSTMFIFICFRNYHDNNPLSSFTFHYVYIYILWCSFFTQHRKLFTFHYVYIYINSGYTRRISEKSIYIPLCLYLYEMITESILNVFLFTFHYVYIYIMSWSNFPTCATTFTFHYVYIYIGVVEIDDAANFRFTFHYVYIYMSNKTEIALAVFRFTFHYVYIYMMTVIFFLP